MIRRHRSCDDGDALKRTHYSGDVCDSGDDYGGYAVVGVGGAVAVGGTRMPPLPWIENCCDLAIEFHWSRRVDLVRCHCVKCDCDDAMMMDSGQEFCE